MVLFAPWAGIATRSVFGQNCTELHRIGHISALSPIFRAVGSARVSPECGHHRWLITREAARPGWAVCRGGAASPRIARKAA